MTSGTRLLIGFTLGVIYESYGRARDESG